MATFVVAEMAAVNASRKLRGVEVEGWSGVMVRVQVGDQGPCVQHLPRAPRRRPDGRKKKKSNQISDFT